MSETLPVPSAASKLSVSAAALAGFADLQGRIAARSLTVWGEHCSECAYPSCYEVCSFYSPRSDLHCRRFEAGIQPIADAGKKLRLSRIRFRHWGKLEGHGPAPVITMAAVRARFAVDAGLASVVGRIPAPYVVKRRLAREWNQRKPVPIAHRGTMAQAFAVESWAADGRDHLFTLTMFNVGENIGHLFQTQFEVGSDYRRLVVPIRDIERLVDLSAPFLIQIEPIGEAAGRDVVFGICDFVAFKPELLSRDGQSVTATAGGQPVKVVVWDLDETVWNGVLAEDGADGVRLRSEAAAAIRALDDRGVLQSIASKNDSTEALAALGRFGLRDYFLHPQINWNPKSQSVADIAAALDLGVDSFVLIDDQPFERAEVAARHPSVRLMTHTEVATMLDHAWFDLPVTAESRRRRVMYGAEVARAVALRTSGDDYLTFLRDSGIRASLRRLDMADAERVYELSQRTNQLNFRGTKYGRDEASALVAPALDRLRLTVRCADRFGDYGLIGFVDVDLHAGEITDLFMSCRVQRKRMEHAVFAWIAREVRSRQHAKLRVLYKQTGRNAASRAMLAELGFTPEGDGSEQVWQRDLSLDFEDSDVVALSADIPGALA